MSQTALGWIILFAFPWMLIGVVLGRTLDPYRETPRAAVPFLLPWALLMILVLGIERGCRWLFGYRS